MSSIFKRQRHSPAPLPAATQPQFEDDPTERLLLLGGRTACRLQPRNVRIRSLADAEFRVFSQWGEDGIIDWLVEHTAVPNTRFVEFGVETFREANCRFLLMNRNWRGLVMDGSAENIAALRAQRLSWMYDLTAAQAFITAENINELLIKNGFAGPLGILSIDIDGNDYWIWEKLTAVDPGIVICEYNANFGDLRPIVVPYDAQFDRFAGHYSGLYFGASIAALRLLAERRGYEFVGTNSNGVNAFFVRKDLARTILPLLDSARAFPSRVRDNRDAQGALSFSTGYSKMDLLRDLPVIDVASGERVKVGEISALYSQEWQALL